MKVTVTERGGVIVVMPAGEVDLQTSPEVRRLLLDHLAQGRNLVVDLSGVSYIDSSGVASLVEGYQVARKGGRRFVLAQVGPAVLRVLQLARLDRVFTILSTVDEGVAELTLAR
ncbi:MAG: anti-anti-sigma regulatory factor [Rhodospirillaceae bacterium]|nr:MAG: anti-anti-sigma regulatory factor [Rhodospirillaceae bacterium]